MAESEKSYKLEPEVIERLLQKLSTDDAFRDRFLMDYQGALESLGHKPPGQPPPPRVGCDAPKRLADKAVIAASLNVLRDSLSNGLSFTINILDDSTPHWPK